MCLYPSESTKMCLRCFSIDVLKSLLGQISDMLLYWCVQEPFSLDILSARLGKLLVHRWRWHPLGFLYSCWLLSRICFIPTFTWLPFSQHLWAIFRMWLLFMFSPTPRKRKNNVIFQLEVLVIINIIFLLVYLPRVKHLCVQIIILLLMWFHFSHCMDIYSDGSLSIDVWKVTWRSFFYYYYFSNRIGVWILRKVVVSFKWLVGKLMEVNLEFNVPMQMGPWDRVIGCQLQKLWHHYFSLVVGFYGEHLI